MSSPRRRTAAAVALAGAMTAALAATPAASAGVVNRTPSAFSHDIRNSTSGNWAGYVATGGGFTSVSAGWTEPAVSCRSQNTYASFWIGLDGDGSNSVEQIGTESDCSGGRAVYSAWYEMYPGGPVDVAGPISPGDAVQASVSYGGSGHFTLVLADRTKGWTRTVQAAAEQPGAGVGGGHRRGAVRRRGRAAAVRLRDRGIHRRERERHRAGLVRPRPGHDGERRDHEGGARRAVPVRGLHRGLARQLSTSQLARDRPVAAAVAAAVAVAATRGGRPAPAASGTPRPWTATPARGRSGSR